MDFQFLGNYLFGNRYRQTGYFRLHALEKGVAFGFQLLNLASDNRDVLFEFALGGGAAFGKTFFARGDAQFVHLHSAMRRRFRRRHGKCNRMLARGLPAQQRCNLLRHRRVTGNSSSG
jgi:hypothetical protein